MIRNRCDTARQLLGFVAQLQRFGRMEVEQIFRHVEHASDFAARAFRQVEKMREVLWRLALKSLFSQ